MARAKRRTSAGWMRLRREKMLLTAVALVVNLARLHNRVLLAVRDANKLI
jgi:hypothetical protein